MSCKWTQRRNMQSQEVVKPGFEPTSSCLQSPWSFSCRILLRNLIRTSGAQSHRRWRRQGRSKPRNQHERKRGGVRRPGCSENARGTVALEEVLGNRKLRARAICRGWERRPLHASLRSLGVILDDREHDLKLVPLARSSQQLLWCDKSESPT